MKLNKQACRKFADPALSFPKGDGLLLCEKICHIARVSVRNISGRRVLIVYFFNRKMAAAGYYEPEYILFQCRDDYITLQRLDDGAVKWRNACLENLWESNTCFSPKCCAFYRLRDEQLVSRFCKIPMETGFNALNTLQKIIMRDRLERRIRKREGKIVELMRTVPPAPRDLKGWIHREVMPQYIFYRYIRGTKPKPGYCSACGHDVLAVGAKHNSAGKCPRCKKSVTFKACGRVQKLWDQETVQVLQKLGENELVLRIFKIYKGFRNWREPNLSIRENARLFIRLDDANIFKADAFYYAYGTCVLTHWKKGLRPGFFSYRQTFEQEVCGHLYYGNLDNALKGTPWQYSQIKPFYLCDKTPLEVAPYLRAYLQHPFIEYLVKLGLYRLAAQIVYDYDGSRFIDAGGATLEGVLGVSANDIPILRQVNANTRQLELYRLLKAQGVKADETLLRWYRDIGCTREEDITYPLRFTTPHKLMGYVNRQFIKLRDVVVNYGHRRFETPDRVLSEYRDYLEFGHGLAYDMANSFVLFPDDLQRAHDQASDLFSKHKAEIFEKVIGAAYPGLVNQYGFEQFGLAVVPPKTAQEITAEGHKLHHCVGGYLERIAKEQCIILFVRHTDQPDSPYYTVEISGDRIVQARGKQNSAPTPDVEKFLALWEQKKLCAASLPVAA